ncbi:hypothetical protein BYT27DRAFT_6692340 [Phlegmacium glaucopus]|nr:hypothetical protein BYT27DRAFT_6692340 [Phlegmacium glaucopus]
MGASANTAERVCNNTVFSFSNNSFHTSRHHRHTTTHSFIHWLHSFHSNHQHSFFTSSLDFCHKLGLLRSLMGWGMVIIGLWGCIVSSFAMLEGVC